jgi:capsular exopolysaccharide synthesis family protein
VSKIFDILNRGKGEIADAIRPMVEMDGVPAPAVEPKPEMQPHPRAEASTAAAESIRTLRFHLPAPSPLLPFEKGQWRPSEQYRILRTKLGQHPKQPHLIVVSSPASGDGKSVTAINVAGALSLKSEGKVLLLDADLRRSAIHTQLGLPDAPGVVDVLKGACTLEEALVHAQDFPNLYVLSAGTLVDNPVELLDSVAWQALCARLKSMFRYVILDSPPVGAVADYDLIQAVSDGVILVIRPDHTDRRLCQKAMENIPKAKFLGVLLNCVPDWKPARNAGSDYYHYSNENAYAKEKG